MFPITSDAMIINQVDKQMEMKKKKMQNGAIILHTYDTSGRIGFSALILQSHLTRQTRRVWDSLQTLIARETFT